MIGVNIIAVGKMKEKFYIDAFNEYSKRLSAYCKLNLTEVPESSIDKEASTVLKYLNKGSHIVSMCIEGKKLSSIEFAKYFFDVAQSGNPNITFIIGGSDGLDTSVKNISEMKLSMSDMTFPHHLARVMLIEQIYRAFKINEGSAYHK